MRILVIGSGAREHALLLGLSQDPAVSDLHVVPGNAGMADLATLHKGTVTDPAEMIQLATSLNVDLVVIGPEIPLVAGVADALRKKGFKVFGPDKDAARIEGSKAFAKDVMAAAGVKTAHAEALAPGASNDDIESALNRFGPTWVVKDDGLAGGKGVVVTPDRDAARAHIDAVHAAGNPVLLETFLDGPEVSLFCLVDGETVVRCFPHRTISAWVTMTKARIQAAWVPTRHCRGFPRMGCNALLMRYAFLLPKKWLPAAAYSGLLYAGLAWGQDGPAVVEFNCRFGDPETQAVLALLKTPLGQLLASVAEGTLAEQPPLEWKDGYALTVVLAAQNYPDSPRTGDVITGAERPRSPPCRYRTQRQR